MDYELLFGISNKSNSKHLPLYNNILKVHGVMYLVVGLTLMYICRLYRYKTDEQKPIVKEMAKRMLKENEEIFKYYS